MPKISYIILTKNSDATLENCLKAIKNQKISKEIIIVDNFSTDDTIPIAKRYGAKIFNEPTGNKAIARNIGLNEMNGQYAGFVDSDCYLTNGWDKRMLRFFAREDVVGAGATNISVKNTWITVELDRLTIFKSKEGVHDTDSIATMNALYDMKKIGNTRFDPDMKNVAEDLEFNMQLRKKGYKLVYDGKTVVLHENPDTLLSLISKSFDYGKGYRMPFDKHRSERSNKLFMYRYLWTGFFLIGVILSAVGYNFLSILLFIVPYVPYTAYSIKPKFIFVHGTKQLATLLGMVVGLFPLEVKR